MMEWFKRLPIIFAMLALFYLLFPQRAYAYIDPGTGSIIIQVLIGVLVGGLVAAKIFWNRISTSVKSLFCRGRKDERAGK